MKPFDITANSMKDVLPKKADWLKTKVASLDPDSNKVTTTEGDDITYEHLVIAMGFELHYEWVCSHMLYAIKHHLIIMFFFFSD